MKDRRYAVTTISKAKVGDKNKTYSDVFYVDNKYEAKIRIAEKVFGGEDVVGISMTRIVRNNSERYSKVANMARKIFRGV